MIPPYRAFSSSTLEGSLQGDPSGFRARPWPVQRCQIHKARKHHGPLAEIDATHKWRRVLRQAWELNDAGQGRDAPSQSRPTSRTRLGGCCRLDPGRARRDTHRNKARTAAGTAAFARLHKHHRECHGTVRRVSRNVKYCARLRWLCVGRRGHAGSRQGL